MAVLWVGPAIGKSAEVHHAQPGEGFQDAIREIRRSLLTPSNENGELSIQVEQHRNVEYRHNTGTGPKQARASA
jgi:hypothetical protein